MDLFSEPPVIADPELQTVILRELEGRRRASVVSTNSIMEKIRDELPDCPFTDEQLVKLVFEASVFLGLVPVFDPQAQCPTRQVPKDNAPWEHPGGI